MQKKISTLCLFAFFVPFLSNGQIMRTGLLQWNEKPVQYQSPGSTTSKEIWSFAGAVYYDAAHPTLPYFTDRFTLSSDGSLSAELVNARFEPIVMQDNSDTRSIERDIQFHTLVTQDRQSFSGNLAFLPIRRTGDRTFERLVSFEVRISFIPSQGSLRGGPANTFTSVLSEGNIYKIGVTQNGVYKIDYGFLKNTLKVENLDNIDPRKIKLFNNGNGMLPEANSQFRFDDLTENAIRIVGEDDGQFNSGDYILFYGQGPDAWKFDNTKKEFNMTKNLYSDTTFYFLKIAGENGLRIGSIPSVAGTDYTTNTFDNYLHQEDDRYNLLDINKNGNTQGSGKQWFGDYFGDASKQRNYVFSDFSNLVASEPVKMNVRLAGSSAAQTKFKVVAGAQTFEQTINQSSPTDADNNFATAGSISGSFTPTGDNIGVQITYPSNSVSTSTEGWLDYIELNARCNLLMKGKQMSFRDAKALAYNSATYQLGSAGNSIEIWNITNPLVPKKQEASLNGDVLSFGVAGTSLQQFIAFQANDGFLSPTPIGKVNNQNLHGLDNIDLVILYHPEFETAVQTLSEHRQSYNGLAVANVLLQDVYNEFSSGAPDPTAIRDFARMLLTRNTRFKFLLLMGDGSFDFKNIKQLEKPDNFIPTYETWESFDPISAYPSDDYYALLSDNEGGGLNGDLDIGIGRIPAKTAEEASGVVNKIIHYDSDPNSLGDWRNRITFVADDEDGNVHVNDCDDIAQKTALLRPNLILNKIYLDAYKQEAGAGGTRVPGATEAINNDIYKGVIAMCYLGHGGPNGWAQERILRPEHIMSWTNFDRLPLIATATCSFAGYDKPNLETAGELCLLNPKGGAIALYSTVRAVYASQNALLTDSIYTYVFTKINQVGQPMGEILRTGKNKIVGGYENTRKFTMLGDPSQAIALPKYNVQTIKVNEHVVDNIQYDTLRAFQKVTIEAMITDDNGQLVSSFNGKAFPTVYDKAVTVHTLNQDPDSNPKSFQLQKNIIFKGAATVTGGKFSFTFVVPKDIDYDYGKGKISYYAKDGNSTDASGSYDKIIIGGTYANAIADNKPPVVDLFMNNENFVFGGNTNSSPTLLAKLSDDNGINVTGTSIGHDLTAVIDDDTKNTFNLNSFYEATLDDYTSGVVRYPLYNLSNGRHRIRVKAWDISNNSGEGQTEFIVVSSGAEALEHVLNYPNPFTDHTRFQFEHHLDDQLVDVEIRIFSVSGRLVKTIDSQVLSSNGYVNNIEWDGKDDFGDQLARGIYLFKVKVGGAGTSGSVNTAESKFEKLVILK